MKKQLSIIAFLTSLSLGASLLTYDSVPFITGNDLILQGDTVESREIINSYDYLDPAYLSMKEAEIALLRGDTSAAKGSLLDATQSAEYAPFAFRRIGDIEVASGNIQHAIVSYRTAASLTDLSPYQHMLVELADSIGSDNRDELMVTGWHAMLFPDFIDESLVDSLLPVLRARLNQGVSKAQFDSLLVEADRIDRRQTLTNSFLDTSLIREPFSTVDIYEHARHLMDKERYSESSQWLHYALGRENFSSTVPQGQYVAFRCALNYKLKNWSNAVEWGKKYIETYGYSSGIIYNIARAYRKMGMMTDANEWYGEHVRRYPHTDRTYSIMWYQAWIYEDNGSFATAIEKYDELSRNFPTKKYGDDAAFRVGLLHFRMGNYTESIEAMESFYSRFGSSSALAPGAYFWIGRAAEANGDSTAAAEAYGKVVEGWPLNYYAWRTREATGTMDEFEVSTTPFETWFEVLKERSRDVEDTLANFDPAEQFRLAVQLGTLGYQDEAVFLVEPIEIRAHRNYAQLYELSRFYDAIGEHYKAFKLSKSIFYSLPRDVRKELPVEFLARLYPEAYPQEIQTAADDFNIEPQLVRSIMRQESMFSYNIFSWVGAAGLMQIMPYTGEEIATDLGVEYENEMLLDPGTNVYFGTYYIGKLLRRWDGHYVKAIASYNGGPHNVSKWVARSEDVLDDDAYFSECIGFSETRNYVKRVLENYWVYKGIEQLSQEDVTGDLSVEEVAVEVSDNSEEATSELLQ